MRRLTLALLLLSSSALAQTYPAPTFQGVTLQADPTAAAQAVRKGYVDAADGLRILSSTLGQPNGPAQLGAGGLLPVAQLPVGTATGTLAAGNDSRITGAAQSASLAPVATTGAYGSLTGTPAAFALPTATTTVLGGVKIDGTTVTISAGVISVPTDATRYAASNPSNYITAAGAPVQSVAGLVGAPTAAQLATALTGTVANTLAAGNDGRITGALSASVASTTYAGLATSPVFISVVSSNPGFTAGTSTTAGLYTLNAPASGTRLFTFQSAGLARWKLAVFGGTESGANVASDFGINRYDDTGASLGTSFAINRATGVVTLSAPLPIASGGSGANTAAGALTSLGAAPLNNTALTGATTAAAVSVSGALSAGSAQVNGGQTRWISNVPGAAADQKLSDYYTDGNNWIFRWVNDAQTANTPWLIAGRSGMTTTGITLTGASITLAGTTTLTTPTSTVAALGTCNAGVEGARRGVSDATAPAFLAALTGGGTVHAVAFCNGTAWVAG